MLDCIIEDKLIWKLMFDSILSDLINQNLVQEINLVLNSTICANMCKEKTGCRDAS